MRGFMMAMLSAPIFCSAPLAVYAESAEATAEVERGRSSDGDQAALMQALGLQPNAQGQVDNGCGENVTPGIFPVALGGAIGTARLVIIPGGPNTLTCNGDGPGLLHLMQRQGTLYRKIFNGRGYLAVLPTMHNGVPELSFGGPGFSFPVLQWNGETYEATERTISDVEFGKATVLP